MNLSLLFQPVLGTSPGKISQTMMASQVTPKSGKDFGGPSDTTLEHLLLAHYLLQLSGSSDLSLSISERKFSLHLETTLQLNAYLDV